MKPFVIDSDAQIGIGETWGSPPRWVDYKVEALLGRARKRDRPILRNGSSKPALRPDQQTGGEGL